MNQSLRPTRICAAFLLGLALAPSAATAGERVPVLIDTDVGADIEDAFALGLAFGADELNIQGVTTVGGDTHKKAMVMCRFLTATGRRHTRVAAGAKPQPSRPITDLQKYYYHPDALFNRTTKPEKQSAADFLYSRLKQQPGRVTLVSIGPLTNVAQLLSSHADSANLIRRLILLESNIALDVAAAKKVIAAGIPLVVITADACRDLRLDDAGVKTTFRPGTALTRQVQTMYQMWDRSHPPLDETLAVALCFEERFAKTRPRSLTVNQHGELFANPPRAESKSQVVTSIRSKEFREWYANRLAALVSPADRPSRLIQDDRMPNRVHVAESFDTDIERFWWMSGKPETKLLPPGGRRACRSVLTHDFDDLLRASRRMYSAVIFNPVPGPPMGKNARLRFRYWLKGTDTLRVQIYSLTNGYHRHLVVKGLPQQQWRQATVAMTEARRPDGTGGPLSENERIDDIQFYVDADAEIVIDDIVLFDAAGKDEKRPFPKRIMFTGVFDTGKQGQHWPGDFDIVGDAGSFWKAARSARNKKSGLPWLRIGLRGQRRLGDNTGVSFRYRLSAAGSLEVSLVNSETGVRQSMSVKQPITEKWGQAALEFDTRGAAAIDEIQIVATKDGELLVDDLLLFEPAEQRE